MKKIAFFLILLCAGMNVLLAQIAAPTLNSPADGYVYPNTVKPLLKINSVSGASYYLFHWSEDPTFATYRSHTMSSSYTGLNVNGLKFGTTYYWRVYAITANYADTSAASAVWSFTTTDAPTITAPADGTVLTNSIMPNIQWTEIVGATNYIYQCDTTPSFNSSLRRTYTLGYQSGGSNPLNLSFGKTYYLRMRATNTNESDTSAWSAVRSFTTSDSITLVSFNDPSPTANYYTRQTLSWKPYRGVTQYFLQLDTTPHFNSPVLQQINHTSSSTSTTDNQSVIINNMRYGSMYYWRVRAANYNGSDTSSWSATWQFHTMDFVNNTDNTINNSDSTQNYYTRQTLYWKNNRGSTKYLLQLDTTPNFNSPILREIYTTNAIDNTTNELSTKVYNMLYGTMYYYRVCAINNAPDTSGWSATWQFHTINKVFSTSNTLNDTTQTETYFTRISMKWENNRGSTQYILQLDTTPDFNSPVFRQVNITNDIDDETNELSTTVYNLLHGAMYYYRICAINNAPDTSDWSNTWQFHTRDKVFLYSPENQTTNASPSTTLQWKNSRGSSKFILQVDTSTNFNSSSLREIIVASSITNNDSYKSYTLNDLRFGDTYYWRVRSVNEAPDTSGWSDVWSFTVTSGVPTLVSPADGYVYPSTVKPLLRLEAVTGASYYLFHWSEDPTFATYSSYTMSSSYTGLNVNGLKFGTTYYWRVYAITDNYADTSASSAVWSFTTTDAPTITAPNDGTILTNSISPNIQWTEMVGATKYIYQCDTSMSFNSPLLRNYTTEYSSGGKYPLNLSFGKAYYLRMRATNTNESDTSAWSAVRTFYTSDAPVLNSPSNGYVYSSSVNPTLKCETIRNIGKYIYQWDTTSNFNSPLCRSTVQTSTSVTVGPLKLGTTYYWRVQATNYNDSDTSSWSTVWSFTTGGSIPTLASPSNGSTAIRLRPTLDWNAVSSCDYYDYECDTTPQFNSPELQSGAIAAGTSEVRLNQLRYGTTYYWRVRIRLNSDTSSWSTVWSFTTAGTIALTSPSNGSNIYHALTTTLDWDFINDGDYYEYQYDLSPDFNSPALVSGQVAVGTSEVDITQPLRFGTTYYWRVREYTSIDTTPWSATWSFNTPAALTLVSPSNNTTVNSTTVTLDWDYINGGTIYECQYDTCATFDSPSLRVGTVAVGTSELTVRYLRLGTTYYWRVREMSAVDTSEWSTVWHFTTGGGIPTLVSPSNNATAVRLRPTIDWNPISSCDYYDYECDVTPQFNSPELQSGTIAVGTSEKQLNQLRYGETYYWRVRIRVGSDTSSWSNVWRFTTANSLALVSPNDGSTLNRTVKPTLDWDYIQDGDYYEYQYDLSANFNTPDLVSGRIAVGTSEIELTNPLRFGETYYWRVREYTTLDTSDWSATWRFTTPGPLALVSPANGTTNVEASVTLDWDYIQGGTLYHYQYDKTPDFTSAELVEGSIQVGTSQVTISNLEENRLYYWRVRELSAVDTTPWSEVWHFSTRMQPIFTDVYDTACDSYTWNGQTYTQSGEYTRQFVTALQADSTVTLHLTIYHSVTSTSSVTVCESDLPYHYVNGDIDTTFGIGTLNLSTFNFQFSTSHGCDSTVILTLNIRSANYTELTETACGSYVWNNEVYEESGDYVQTFTNAAGCDSVVTLHLTIFTANYTDFADNACGSYVWNDEVYEESGDYVQTFTNVNGCDSVVTLHLTIYPADHADFADSACGSYTWNDEVYTESGDYTQTFTNANGCDSTVTLHLTIYEPATELVELTICESELPYHYVNGEIDTIFEVGTPNLSVFSFQFSTQYGCDSTVTLHLTIEPCDTNGINENGMANLTLYPNPTTGMVNVQFTMNNKQWENAEIQVLDVYGRLLRTVETCHGASLQIDLSHYATGIYLVRWMNGGKVMAVRKVVKE